MQLGSQSLPSFSIMSPILTSQGLVFATAMAVSAGTILLFDLLKDKYFPPHIDPPLKSCLSSGSKKREKKKSKKRVQFSDNVKDSKGNGEVYRRQRRLSSSADHRIQTTYNNCGNYEILEFQRMPANRAALYNGILRDRLHHRMEYSY